MPWVPSSEDPFGRAFEWRDAVSAAPRPVGQQEASAGLTAGRLARPLPDLGRLDLTALDARDWVGDDDPAVDEAENDLRARPGPGRLVRVPAASRGVR